MKLYRLFILWFIFLAFIKPGYTQKDKKALVAGSPIGTTKDTLVVKDTIPKHNPRIATKRSALIPGWGQAYNKEYWKIPFIYGILAIPVATYFYNDDYYKKTKFAYEARFKETYNKDSSDIPLIDPQLKGLSITSLQSYRNAFRQDRDYSIVWFILAWGLQVADATVFAHLKQFDVSNDLSMRLLPLFNPHTITPGFGLTLSLKNPTHKIFDTR